LVSNEEAALAYIEREYEGVSKVAESCVEPLDGDYSRVYLSCLNDGLTPKTLARLFCLSAKKEEGGDKALTEKIEVAKALVKKGDLPLDAKEFAEKLATWARFGYPALHHSDAFRAFYKPAYRVIANRYVELLPMFAKIDKLLAQDSANVTAESQSIGVNAILAQILQEVYGGEASRISIRNF
jgi:hypothetical protein